MKHSRTEITAERRRKEDLALVRSSLAGDESALEELARRFQCVPRVLSILNGRMGNALSSHDLADLAQDVLVLVWTKLPSFEGRAKIETWTSRFCFREYMNAIRRKGRTMNVEHIDSVMETVPAPEEREPARYDHVLRQLDELGPPEAEVIRLKHFDHRTFKDIGDLLEISPNTAKTHYYRGIAWLRKQLAPRGEEERT